MLTESFVAIMALVAACVLDPGIYFAMNSPAALIGTTTTEAAQTLAQWGFVITPQALDEMAVNIGENSVLSRAGGAATLAVGMAKILSDVFGGVSMMAFWYHFAILFEALFILTTLDAGTRVCRFLMQDAMGFAMPSLAQTQSWFANVLATGLTVAAWGWFLYQGVTDPFGGINSLWALFGIANQMLAGIALMFATVLLVRMKKTRYVWVTALPTLWILIVTLTAGWQKVFSDNVNIGFLSHAQKFSAAIEANTIITPAKSMEQMQAIVRNDYVNAVMACLFMSVMLAMLFFSLRAIRQALRESNITVRETVAVWRA